MDDYAKQLLAEIERTRRDNDNIRGEIDTIRTQPPSSPMGSFSRGREPGFVRAASRCSSVASDNGMMGASGPNPYLRRWDPNAANVYSLQPAEQDNVVCRTFPVLPGDVVTIEDAAPWVTCEWYLYDESMKKPGSNKLYEGPEFTVTDECVFHRLCCQTSNGLALCRPRVNPRPAPSAKVCSDIMSSITTKGIRAFSLHRGDAIQMLVSNKGVKIVQRGEVVVCSVRWRHKPVLEVAADNTLSLYCVSERKKHARVEVPIEAAYLDASRSHRDSLLSTFFTYLVLSSFGGSTWSEKATISTELLKAIGVVVRASLGGASGGKEWHNQFDYASYSSYAASVFLHVVSS